MPTYNEMVLADNPVAFWPLDDSGTDRTARDLGPNDYTLGPSGPDPEPGVPGPFDRYVESPRTGWTASDSTGSLFAYDPINAIDNDSGTSWVSANDQTVGMYWQVDLGATYSCGRITMEADGDPGQYPRAYNVLVSPDGVTWTVVASATGSAAPLLTVDFDAHSTRWLRVQLTAAAGAWWAIAEFRAYSHTIDYAVRFREGGAITGPETTMPTNGAVTLEAWVKDDSPSSPIPGQGQWILGCGDPTFAAGFVALFTIQSGSGGTGSGGIGFGWTSAAIPRGLANSSVGVGADYEGVWHHVALTLNDSSASVYLDGVPSGSNPNDISFWPPRAAPATGSFWIGAVPGGYQALWADLAYGAVYDYELNGTQLAAHAACTTAAAYTGAVLGDCPLAFWPLQER